MLFPFVSVCGLLFCLGVLLSFLFHLLVLLCFPIIVFFFWVLCCIIFIHCSFFLLSLAFCHSFLYFISFCFGTALVLYLSIGKELHFVAFVILQFFFQAYCCLFYSSVVHFVYPNQMNGILLWCFKLFCCFLGTYCLPFSSIVPFIYQFQQMDNKLLLLCFFSVFCLVVLVCYMSNATCLSHYLLKNLCSRLG